MRGSIRTRARGSGTLCARRNLGQVTDCQRPAATDSFAARCLTRRWPPAPAATTRILVVDDDPQIRGVLLRMLRAQGYQVADAADTDAALAWLATEGAVPLVLSDLHMPGRDGVTLLRELSARYPDTAVVMLTGDDDIGNAVECLKIGAVRLSHQADAGAGSPRPGREGARRTAAGARSAAPPRALPGGPRTPGARIVAQEPGDVPGAGPDGRHHARSQGSLHPRPLAPGGDVRRRNRPPASASRWPCSSRSGWAASCTTSARSEPATQFSTSPAGSPTRNSPRCAGTPSKARRC